MVPFFTEPKLHSDRGPLESGINRDLPGPWMPGTTPKCGTAHRNRPFIAGNLVSRNEDNSTNYWSNQEASGSEEEEEEKVSEDDISTDEIEDRVNDPSNKQHK